MTRYINNNVNKYCDSNCYLGQATDLINYKLLFLNFNGHVNNINIVIYTANISGVKITLFNCVRVSTNLFGSLEY